MDAEVITMTCFFITYSLGPRLKEMRRRAIEWARVRFLKCNILPLNGKLED